jgi:hypothetical protein
VTAAKQHTMTLNPPTQGNIRMTLLIQFHTYLVNKLYNLRHQIPSYPRSFNTNCNTHLSHFRPRLSMGMDNGLTYPRPFPTTCNNPLRNRRTTSRLPRRRPGTAPPPPSSSSYRKRSSSHRNSSFLTIAGNTCVW